MSKKFYVYIHCRLDTGEPFYVGKGTGRRDTRKAGRSKWWSRIVSLHGYSVTRIFETEDEQAAFDKEIEVIKELREVGVTLCNLTDGGEGRLNIVVSPETREKIRIANLGKKRTPESVAKTNLANSVRVRTPEEIAKSAATRTGAKRTPEACERIRQAKIASIAAKKAIENAAMREVIQYE